MAPIPVFFTPLMVADSRSVSPSAAKPAKVVASWQRQFPIEIVEPLPVNRFDLERAHDAYYIGDVLECRANNGFGNRSPEVAASLPYTSGAMLAAARHALKTGKVACAPVSGFHHAGFLRPEGFCTFNGLMVTALALKAEGAKRVGILDLDMHYGNGTDEIIDRLGARDWVWHFTAGLKYEMPHQADEFFDRALPDAIDWLGHCDVVLYQAGADPHVNDPFGGWLTTEQLRRRDAMVFDEFSSQGVPVAWDLAGGYQVDEEGNIPKVLEIHDNTMRECVRAYGG